MPPHSCARSYDRHGRLVETAADFGSRVTYAYDARGRLARQTVDGTPIDYAYTRHGRLAGKYLGGRLDPDAAVEYEYSPSGRVVARTANGVRQDYGYDRRGRLVAVREDGADVERYAYDAAGNVVRRTVRGRTTTFAFDAANQLVSSTCGGVTTRYAYDAAGRLVREGDRAYRYGYLDKVLAVTGGGRTLAYAYHPDGQLARADYGGGRAEDFEWDGLALVRRGDERFVNEPHPGGGNPVVSSKGVTYLNDALGTTVGARRGARYSAAALTAFGEGGGRHAFFTGKPLVEGLGRAFLMRNYRADLAKWQTADPLGYPDGWNQLAYCGNEVTGCMDALGLVYDTVNGLTDDELKHFSLALNRWLDYANNTAYPIVWYQDLTLTLRMLNNYKNRGGDMFLPYSEISESDTIQAFNDFVRERANRGVRGSGAYPITQWRGWHSSDLSHSLGKVLIQYDIVDLGASAWRIDCLIQDRYWFHDYNMTATFGQISSKLIGGAVGWYYESDTIPDLWMHQLHIGGYAKEYYTTIRWSLSE